MFGSSAISKKIFTLCLSGLAGLALACSGVDDNPVPSPPGGGERPEPLGEPTFPVEPLTPTVEHLVHEVTDPMPVDRFAYLGSPRLPGAMLSYEDKLPPHFRTEAVERFDNTPADNELTDAGATLGRVLFYDRRLSKNGEVACASCHKSANGFSDNKQFSVGFDGQTTRRHSMALTNLRFYRRGSMFWDERAKTLEEQVLMPIQDMTEMGLTLQELALRLEATDFYPPLFKDAFGDPEVTSDRVSRALAQFIRSIVSYRSKWDEGVVSVEDARDPFPNYTGTENRGKDLFFGRHHPNAGALCAGCHLTNQTVFSGPGVPGQQPPPPPGGMAPLGNVAFFFMSDPRDNGLVDPNDMGHGDVSGLVLDQGAFKSPSLRNVARTAPYMHDGRFETLEEVVEYYSHEIESTDNLDHVLRDEAGNPLRLDLSAEDTEALVAFLRTLTDVSLAQDERWSDPF